MATNAVNVATDILTLLPPIIVYSKMKMRARLKIIVLGIFLVGFV